MLSNNNIIVYDHDSQSIVNINPVTGIKNDFNLNCSQIVESDLAQIIFITEYPEDISVDNPDNLLLLTKSHQVYLFVGQQCRLIDFSEKITSISYWAYNVVFALDTNGTLYFCRLGQHLENIDDIISVKIDSEIISEYITPVKINSEIISKYTFAKFGDIYPVDFLLTSSGQIYNYIFDVNSQETTRRIQSTLTFVSMCRIDNRVVVLDTSGHLHVVHNGEILPINEHPDLIFQSVYSHGYILHLNGTKKSRRITTNTIDDTIVEFVFKAKNNIYTLVPIQRQHESMHIVDIIDLTENHVFVNSEGRVYNPDTGKFLEYFDTNPIRTRCMAIKSARTTAN